MRRRVSKGKLNPHLRRQTKMMSSTFGSDALALQSCLLCDNIYPATVQVNANYIYSFISDIKSKTNPYCSCFNGNNFKRLRYFIQLSQSI